MSMKTPEPDDIDGRTLKAAREARNKSVPEMALFLTLSREQVQQIESGGLGAFYSPQHKLLAVKKYASRVGVDFDSLLRREPPGAPATTPKPAAPAGERLLPPGEAAAATTVAAAEPPAPPPPLDEKPTPQEKPARQAKSLKQVRTVLQSKPTMRAEPVAQVEPATQPESVKPEASETPPPAEARPTAGTPVAEAAAASPPRLRPPVLLAGGALLLAGLALLAHRPPPADGGLPLAQAALPSLEPVRPVAAAHSAEEAVAASPAAAPASEADDAGECKAFGQDPSLPSWMPPYPRRPDGKLYLKSANGASVCIVDASGAARLIQLKPNSGYSYSGKPPYTIRSSRLASIDIYLQGLKVKVPPTTEAIRLVPARGETQSVLRDPESSRPVNG